jgi:hypothetical protein
MHIDMIVGLVLIFFVVVVPILGVTARLALKPVVESVLALRDAMQEGSTERLDEPQLAHLQDEVAELNRAVQELRAARDWEASLIPPGRRDQVEGVADVPRGESPDGHDRLP